MKSKTALYADHSAAEAGSTGFEWAIICRIVDSGGLKLLRLHSTMPGDLYWSWSANSLKSPAQVDLHKPPSGTTLVGHALFGPSLFGGTSILGFSSHYETNCLGPLLSGRPELGPFGFVGWSRPQCSDLPLQSNNEGMWMRIRARRARDSI